MKQEKIVLYGLGAVGKSASIATLFKLREQCPNLRVIFLCTERNALSGLEWGLKHYKIKLEKNQLITCVIRNKKKKAFTNELRALTTYAKQSAGESQQNDKNGNMNKDKYTDFTNIISGLMGFKGIDYATNEEVELGNVGELEYEDILVVDGLTPIMLAIWESVKGDRVGGTMADYQVVQYWLKKFTKNLIDIDASTILLAHADRIYDEIAKEERIRIGLDAGTALAGKYAGSWGDVIYAYQSPTGQRYWTGKKNGVEVAVRNFPEQDRLEPDFSKYNFFK